MNLDHNPRYITPLLPPKAYEDMHSWRSRGQYHMAFVRPLMQIEPLPDGQEVVHCKNCVDADFVMVSFVRAGPFARVTNHKRGETLVWFDGNDRAGKGWYIIAHTVSYDCPMCRPHGDRQVSPPEVLDKAAKEEFPWQVYTE